MKDKKNILTHLKNSGSGFKTPEHYFDDFEIESDSYLKGMTSKKQGFKVPGGYFDNLTDEILDQSIDNKIPVETGFKVQSNYFEDFSVNLDKPKSKTRSLYPKFKRTVIGFSVAASLLILFSIQRFSSTEEPISIDELSYNEIESWIDDNIVVYHSYDIADIYSDVEIAENNLFLEDELSDYLSEKDIEYLYLQD